MAFSLWLLLFSACFGVSLAATTTKRTSSRDTSPHILAVVIEGKTNVKPLPLTVTARNQFVISGITARPVQAGVRQGSGLTTNAVGPLLFGFSDGFYGNNGRWGSGSVNNMMNGGYQQPNLWNIPGIISQALLFPSLTTTTTTTTRRRNILIIVLTDATPTSPTITCQDYTYRLPAVTASFYRCCGHDIYYYPTQTCVTRSAPSSSVVTFWVPPPTSSTGICCNGVRYYVTTASAASYTCCGTQLINSAASDGCPDYSVPAANPSACY